MADGEKIIGINIEEEMKSKYIDYSMSVIVSRALPDVRDGLKPVHRRVLYGMNELGVTSNKAYKKAEQMGFFQDILPGVKELKLKDASDRKKMNDNRSNNINNEEEEEKK